MLFILNPTCKIIPWRRLRKMGKGEKTLRKSPRKRSQNASESQGGERNRRNWRDEEVRLILDYIKSTIQRGRSIEKPNARAYYKKMVEDLKFSDCDAVSVINKIRLLKNDYTKAKEWRDQTGQGVEEGTINEELKKRCRFFEHLDEIYSERASVIPPYSAETVQIGEAQSDLDDLSETEPVRSPPPTRKELSPVPLKKAKSAKGISPKNADFSVIVKRRQDIQSDEVKNETARIALETRRGEMEASIQNEKLELEKERFRLESTIRKEELQFRKEQLQLEKERSERDHELEKFRIEQNVKLQIELAKLKST